MGIIRVKTNDGIVRVRIAGDTPTAEESFKIKQQFAPRGASQSSSASFEQMVKEARAKERDEGFDYETGADSSLRALMSFGETAEEQEAILQKLVGSEGYTRDSSGRLSLTPAGQQARGLDPINGNLVIEDEGFSFGDVADLAGIIPETVGSITGAILTSPGILTSAGGAAAGAAAGQALEEGIESILGIQKQSLGEVAGDVATEAVIAGTVDLVTMGTFAAAKGLVSGGRKVISRPLAEATEEGGERGLRLIEEGAAPSLERLGAPATMAYAQKLAEGATKDTTRLIKNTNFALEKADFFRALANNAEAEDAGRAFADATSKRFAELKQAQTEASNSALKSVQDSINLIERSLDEGFDINDATLGSIVDSFQNFSRVSGNEFRLVDDMLGKLEFQDGVAGIAKEGGKARVINTGILEGAVKDLEEAVGARSVLPKQVQQAIRGVEEMASKQRSLASFEQIANQRKLVNDAIFDNDIGGATAEQLFRLRDAFDQTLESTNLMAIKGIRPNQRAQLKAIADQRDVAFRSYREGRKVFDDLQKFGIVRNMKAASKDPRFNVDQFFRKVIRPSSPERLKAVLNAVDNPDLVREQLARAYLDDAMMRTSIDLMDPTQFNGMKFKGQIDALGSTGKELFGANWNQVKRLANTIAQSGPTKIDAEVIARINQVSPDANIVTKLEELLEAKQAFDVANSSKVIRDFNSGTLSPEDAARYLVNPQRSVTEINKIKKFFAKDPEAIEAIKNYAINDIVSSVGDDVFSSTGAALQLDRIVNKQFKPGALDALIGKESAEGLRQFAADLAYLGDVGKEGAIVAASYAAHPISKAGAKARMTMTSKIFANERIMRKFAEGSARKNAQQFGGTVADALDAGLSVMAQTQRPIRQVAAQAIQQQVSTPRGEPSVTPTPTPVQSSGIGSVDVTQPLSPNIRPLSPGGLQPNLREMATNNPAVAEALGIRGATAGLLGR